MWQTLKTWFTLVFTRARRIDAAKARRLLAASDQSFAFRNHLERQIRERSAAGFSFIDLPVNCPELEDEVNAAIGGRGFDIGMNRGLLRISWH